MTTPNHPKAFICHSTKDKQRFVLDFTSRLLNAGIDSWVDDWEMRLGDSLPREIFDGGIKNCDTFIIVLSKHSIKSDWLKEELDVAVVRKIEDQTRLIPIIIDEGIEIPTVLRATLWMKIHDLKSYDDEFDKIVNAILGISEKPHIGKLPEYAIQMVTIGGLSNVDSQMLKLIIEYLIKEKIWTLLLTGLQIMHLWEKHEIPITQAEESLEILDDESYIIMQLTTEDWIGSPFSVTSNAIVEYAENYVEDFDIKSISVISNIVNQDIRRSDTLSEHVDLPIIIVNALINEWADLGYIKYFSQLDRNGAFGFQKLTTTGKRYFEEQLNR